MVPIRVIHPDPWLVSSGSAEIRGFRCADRRGRRARYVEDLQPIPARSWLAFDLQGLHVVRAIHGPYLGNACIRGCQLGIRVLRGL